MARYAITVDLKMAADFNKLPEKHRTCVYRVAQEAMTNCARHAEAKHIGLVVAMRQIGAQRVSRHYLDLSSSSQSANSWFLQDMQAEGVCSRRDQTADLLYEGTAPPVVFDGDWPQHGKSERDYEDQLESADERYSRMLEILIRIQGE